MTAPDQTNAEISDERLREIIEIIQVIDVNVPPSIVLSEGIWECVSEKVDTGWSITATRYTLNRRSVTSQASEGEVALDRFRERIDALRLGHRRKMSDAAARAEMSSATGNMSEASIASTESECHREAFVALNVTLDIFDGLYAAFPSEQLGGDVAKWRLVPTQITDEMWQAFFVAKDDIFPEQQEAARQGGGGWKGLPAVVWEALLAAAPRAPAAPNQSKRVERLEAALKPFAALLEASERSADERGADHSRIPDDRVAVYFSGGGSLLIGDFRRAAQAIGDRS